MQTRADINQILLRKLDELCERNPGYSLRALAKKLNLSPSHLSRVLRQQKHLSYQTSLRIARELNIPQHETQEILDSATERKKTGRSNPVQSRDPKLLEYDTFKVISEWYYFPLLELVRTKGFKSQPAWIAKRLGISVPLVTAALRRLEGLGFIQMTNGQITLSENSFLKTSDDLKAIAIRRHHEQMLGKSLEALENQDVLRREFQGLNLNFDLSQISEAKSVLREFTKRFNKKFGKASGEEVYQLNLQFFSLTG